MESISRYLELLEADRVNWWSEKNFEKWKALYISEYERGRLIISMLRRHVPDLRDVAGSRVLDVGCGDGGVLIALAEAGAICFGIEPNPKNLGRARVRAEEHAVSVDLREGVAEELLFPDASFDLVISDNVLEHVADPERSLSEIRRVLRPGGVLYLVTPKPFALYSLWKDPHYELAGLVLMPRPLQVWYYERIRGGGRGNFGVGHIPTRWVLGRLLAREGFCRLAAPRDLWLEYVQHKIGGEESAQSGPRKRLADWLRRREWPFTSGFARWLWDVVIGSNFFIVRKEG